MRVSRITGDYSTLWYEPEPRIVCGLCTNELRYYEAKGKRNIGSPTSVFVLESEQVLWPNPWGYISEYLTMNCFDPDPLWYRLLQIRLSVASTFHWHRATFSKPEKVVAGNISFILCIKKGSGNNY